MSLRANLTLLLVCAVLPAQVAEKPLTNSDVENMVRAGLPEGSVILAIQRAAERNNTNFDQSTNGLIALRNAGATEDILNTILIAPNIPPYEPSGTVRGLPPAAGLYYQAGSNFSALDSVMIWPQVDPRFKTNWKTLGAWDSAHEVRHYVLDGRQAQVRVTGPRPAFYLRNERPKGGWYIMRLNMGPDRREAIAHIPDVFARQQKLIFNTGDPVRLDPTSAASDVLTLRPAADLAPGQYLVFKTVPGQPWLIQGYAFEVGS
jgi:hypothetical protein